MVTQSPLGLSAFPPGVQMNESFPKRHFVQKSFWEETFLVGRSLLQCILFQLYLYLESAIDGLKCKIANKNGENIHPLPVLEIFKR